MIELGGFYKYDFIFECIYLIVGNYDIVKYCYVVRECFDIKFMVIVWVEVVWDFWVRDVEIDFVVLEK